jgi:hypothetical protein
MVIQNNDMIKHGSIIRFKDATANERNWIALNVTEDDIKNGANAESPGLHGFGGMWYGENVYSRRSYGKMIVIDSADDPDFNIIHEDSSGLSVDEIKRLTN